LPFLPSPHIWVGRFGIAREATISSGDSSIAIASNTKLDYNPDIHDMQICYDYVEQARNDTFAHETLSCDYTLLDFAEKLVHLNINDQE
jgi:hypothetical protein